jgi:hypothetical protein
MDRFTCNVKAGHCDAPETSRHREMYQVRGPNLLTEITFIGMLIFAFFMRHQSSWMGTGWATGICVLVFVSAGYRVWVLRRTWRPQTQSTRAFVDRATQTGGTERSQEKFSNK